MLPGFRIHDKIGKSLLAGNFRTHFEIIKIKN